MAAILSRSRSCSGPRIDLGGVVVERKAGCPPRRDVRAVFVVLIHGTHKACKPQAGKSAIKIRGLLLEVLGVLGVGLVDPGFILEQQGVEFWVQELALRVIIDRDLMFIGQEWDEES